MWHIRRAVGILANGVATSPKRNGERERTKKKSRPKPGLSSNVQPLIKRGLTVRIVAAQREQEQRRDV